MCVNCELQNDSTRGKVVRSVTTVSTVLITDDHKDKGQWTIEDDDR